MAYETGNPDKEWIKRRNKLVRKINESLSYWKTEFRRLGASGESTEKAEKRIDTLEKRLARLGYNKKGFLGRVRWRKVGGGEARIETPKVEERREPARVDVAEQPKKWTAADQAKEWAKEKAIPPRRLAGVGRPPQPPVTAPAGAGAGGFNFKLFGVIVGLILGLGTIIYLLTRYIFPAIALAVTLVLLFLLIWYIRRRNVSTQDKAIAFGVFVILAIVIFSILTGLFYFRGPVAGTLTQAGGYLSQPTTYLLIFGVILAILAIYYIGKSNVSSTKKFLIISAIVLGLVLIFFFWSYISFVFTTGIFQTLANLTGFSWIIGLIIAGVGGWLFYKSFKIRSRRNSRTARRWGIFLVLLGLFFGWFAPAISQIAVISGVAAALYSAQWLVSLGLGVLGLFLLFSKNYKGLGIFLIILGIAFWFLIPFIGSEIAQKYGLKGEIELEESGLVPRLKRFWYYVQHPEEYFASYGEFTNPNVQQKGPPKGLKIVSFGPVIPAFRSDQDIRLLAEVKNYAIPSIESNNDDGSTPGNVNVGFQCTGFNQNKSVKGEISISTSCGKPEGNIIKDISKDKECNFFVSCKFEKETFKVSGKDKDRETFRATLSSNYENFITESVLKTYVIGKKRYDDLLNRENWEVELLNELRGSASFPGLIKNDRSVTSEYTGGPVQLAVNILDPQPLYPREEERDYTLFVNSKPDAAEWEGNVKANSLFLVVPNWLQLTDTCDFTGPSSGDNNKRLALSEDGINLLKECYGDDTKKAIRGCTFICDFKIDGNIQENIEEYNIRAFQSSNYFLNSSTTFDIVDFKRRIEGRKEEDNETISKDDFNKTIGDKESNITDF